MTPEERKAAYWAELTAHHQRMGMDTAADVPYRLQRIGVPADIVLAIRNPSQRLALDWAKKFIVADRSIARFLVLVSGTRGIGKSVAAGWVLADAVRRHEWNNQPSGGRQWDPFVWAKASEISSVTEFGRVDPEWLEGLRRCRVLVIDDMGHEGTQPGLTALRDVLIHRYEKHAATVITANLAPSDFKARYGESWFSRMASSALMPDLSQEKTMRKRT